MASTDDLIRLHNPNHMLAVKERKKQKKKKKEKKKNQTGASSTGHDREGKTNVICSVCSMSSSAPCVR